MSNNKGVNINHWHIVGNGAIGNLVSYHLHQHKMHYQVIDRDSTVRTTLAHINNQYYSPVVKGNSQATSFKMPLCALANTDFIAKKESQKETRDGSSPSIISNVILPLKAFQINKAFDILRPFLSDKANIILLHNGMGCSDELNHKLKASQTLFLASTTHGAFKPEPLVIKHTGLGSTYIGYASNRVTATKQTHHKTKPLPPIPDFISAFSPCDWDDNIQLRLWHKLAINCCINPLTALSQKQNSSVLNTEYKLLLIDICKEVTLCASTQGLSLDWQYLYELSLDVAEKTGENYSSMNRDIYFKRPTEIDYINGYICKVADKHSLKTPKNQSLVNQVKALSPLNSQ